MVFIQKNEASGPEKPSTPSGWIASELVIILQSSDKILSRRLLRVRLQVT
jgi:hypothetical protein